MSIDDQILFMLGEIRSDLKTALSATEDHELRIRDYESWKYWLLGAAFAISGVTSAAAWVLHG